MSEKTLPRQFTSSRVIYDKMLHCYQNNGIEIDVSSLFNGLGQMIPRSTLAQTITRLTADYFPMTQFYTRTIDGRVMLGCHNPARAIAHD